MGSDSETEHIVKAVKNQVKVAAGTANSAPMVGMETLSELPAKADTKEAIIKAAATAKLLRGLAAGVSVVVMLSLLLTRES
jgi:hypothetical protein